jgi:Nucleotidyl transferase AbiEii toxin, Type IV TA system
MVSQGGFALELRLSNRARTTRDVDIDWQAPEEELFDALIDAAAVEGDDFFTFEIERRARRPSASAEATVSAQLRTSPDGSSRPSPWTSGSRRIRRRTIDVNTASPCSPCFGPSV